MHFVRAAIAAIVIAAVAPLLSAQTYTTGFEAPFTLGDVNGQGGWGHLSNSPTGGTIVPVPAGSPSGFGAQSLQFQTRNVDFFGVANHLYSALVTPAAGETGATAEGAVVPNPNNTFVASFWYHTPVAPVISTRGDGRFAELNPSSKGPDADDPANRYAQVRLVNTTNTAAGLVRAEIGWYTMGTSAASFQIVTAANNLAWNTWYRFDYLIHLVDGLDGTAPNDRFRFFVFNEAGTLLGSACGSTWETAFKTGTFGGGTAPRAINGFDFWSQTGPNGTVVGFIDDLTLTTSNQVVDAPQVSVSGTSNVCAGGSTTLTANASGGTGGITAYTWRDAANAIVGTTSSLVAGAGTYTVAVTDSFCSTTTSTPFVVSEFAPLTASITGNTSVCFGGTTTLSANVSGGSGSIIGYEWRDGSNAIVGNGANVVVGAGTYTVRVTDASCGFVTSEPVTVQTTCPATPIITVSGGPFTYDATPHPATATATDGSGNPVSGSFTFTYDGSPTVPTNAGTYAVVATFTSSDQNYSDGVGNGTLVINRAPTTTTITAVTPSPSIVGQPVRVQFTIGGIFGTPGGTVTVTDGTSSCVAAATATECTLTFNTEGTRTIVATFSGDANHFGSSSNGRQHTVGEARATATVDGLATICEGGSATIRVRLTGNGPWQITWSDGFVETVSTSPHLRTVSPTQTTFYTVTAVVDQDGAGDTFGTAVVTINSVPAPTITASGNGGIGRPLTLTASVGYSSYQWFRNGAAIAGATARVFSIPSVTASDLGTYTVTGTRDGCTSTASAAYSLRPLSLPSDNAVIPVVGNTRGVGGALFRTTVHLVNASGQRITGEITFIDDRVPRYPYDIEAGDTLFIDDLLPESYSGLTSANVIRQTGPLPTAVVHVFDDGGILGTEGMIERIVRAEEALVVGDSGVLLSPIDPVAARFTVGMRSLSSGLTFRVTRRSAAGVFLGTVTRAMPPNALTHEPVSMLIGENIGSSESLTFEILEGSGVIYGTATDNGTNDPNMQIASRVLDSGVTERFVLPVAGRTLGAFGSDFATDVQIHNPSPVQITGTLTFRPALLEIPVTIEPFATLPLPDIFVRRFLATGLGALDLTVTAAVRPVAVARVFNFADEGQTSVSMTFVPQEDVLVAGDEGVLAAPHLPDAARFNIGVRALTAVRATATVRSADGEVLRTVPLTFGDESFQQSAASVLLGYTFTGDESVVFRIEEGSAVIYGVWTDNVTQDPALQYAVRQ